MARHYPSEGVKPAENKREAGPSRLFSAGFTPSEG